MLTKQQLIKSLAHETRIVKHLSTKIAGGAIGYRPTPGQRSMLELMQYLTVCVWAPARYIADGNWDAHEEIEAQSKNVNQDNFARAMDEQLAAVTKLIEAIPHAELTGKMTAMPWGAPCTVGEGLVNMMVKCLTAYRMQFFLYVKESGRPDIGPANCWVGVDWKAPEQTATS